MRRAAVNNAGLGIENFHNHLAGGEKALNIVDDHRKVGQRVGERPGQGVKQQHFARRQLPINHENTAYQQGRNRKRL